MAVSLTLLTLHVLLVLLADAITNRSRDPRLRFAPNHRQALETDGRKDGNAFERHGETFEVNGKTFEGDGETFEGDGKTFEGDGKTFEGDGKTFGGYGKTSAIPKAKIPFATWKNWFDGVSSPGGPAAGVKSVFKDPDLVCTWKGQFQWEEAFQPVGPSNVCGDGYCNCSLHYADCSGHYGGLSYIPMLPDGIQFLNFSHNGLRTIENENFFTNVTNRIYGISLSDNELTYISPAAIKSGLRNMYEVYLDFNFLNVTQLQLIMAATGDTLERLDYRGGVLGPLPSDLFYTYPMPRLKGLNLYDNKIEILNMTAFKPLRNLEYLSVEKNDIRTVVPDSLPSLKVLNMGDNMFLRSLLETCANNQSLLPNLFRLDYSWNFMRNLTGPVCLPKLAVLDLSDTFLWSFPADTFGARNFPRLCSLRMGGLIMRHLHFEPNAFRNPSLSVLSLRNNNIYFGNESVDPGMFSGLTNLTSLDLGWNSFSGVSETKFWQLFSNMTSLQTLNLQGNDIEQLYDGAFDNMTQLRDLNLGTNRISMVKESTFSPETRKRLRHLDLGGNPFNCSKDLVWFCQWMRADPGLFNNSFKDYQCANIAGTDVTSICASASDAVEAPKTITIYRVREVFLLFLGMETTAKPRPQREKGGTPVTPPLSALAHNPWSHELYTTAVVSASLLILLVVVAVIGTVCSTRHGRLRGWSMESKPLPTKANSWRRLVEEEGVTCSTLTLTDKK